MAAETGMPDWLQSILILVSLGAIIYLTLKQARDVARVVEEQRLTIYTEIVCGSNIVRREFKEGDYVGGPASDCEGGKIIGIYAIPPPQGKGGRTRSRGSSPRTS